MAQKKAPEGAFLLLTVVDLLSGQQVSESVANADCVAFVTRASGDVARIADRVRSTVVVLHA
jgi:hypothetical protein